MLCRSHCITLIFLCLICQLTYAQDWYNDPEVYNGAVILSDRSTVRGMLSYNQSSEFLLFKNGQTIAASEALYFQYYDPKEKFNRYYFSHINDHGQYRFYEVLLNGKLQLYRKTIAVETDYVDRENSHTTIYLNKMIIEDKLYLNLVDTISLIDDFETQVLPLLKDQIEAISNYIVSNQLDIKTKTHQIMIIDHYNDLFEKN